MRDPDQTRGKILAKSGVLFNTRGYQATSISDITTATGYTKGAIYRHFKSKANLERKTLSYLSSVMFENLRAVITNEATAGDKLRSVFRYFESYVSNPPHKGGCPLMNAAIEADDANPSLRREALKILDVLTQSLRRILENGLRHKQIKKDIDPEYYATIMIASLEGAIMMSKLRRNNLDVKRVVMHLHKLVGEIEI
jgi:AcrR family transcriptional regulator